MNHPTSGTLAVCPVCSMPDGRHVLGCPAHDTATCKGCQEFGWAPHDATLLDLGYQDHCKLCGLRLDRWAGDLCRRCYEEGVELGLAIQARYEELLTIPDVGTPEPPRVALAAAVALMVALVAFAVLVFLA